MTPIQKKMDELFKQMEAVRLLAESEGRALTAPELEKRRQLKAEIDELCRQQDAEDEDRELRTRLYGDDNGENRSQTLIDPNQTGMAGFRTSADIYPEVAPKKKDYRSLFGIKPGQSLDRGGFRSLNEFLSVLHSGRSDERLKMVEDRAMTIGSSTGGFAVPEEFSAWLLDSSLEGEIVRPRATVWPMITETMKVPGWDMLEHKNSLFGGLVAEWIGESATATEKYAKLRRIMLMAKKLACYTSASNELVADGVSFEDQLSSALVATIGFYLDYAFIQGTGAGQPLGILNDPALITVTKETGQLHNTILYTNIVKMFARLAPQCMAKAVWIANQTTIPDLMTLSVSIGTGGQLVPAVTQQGGKFYLLTKEILFTEKCPALGYKGDLILADLSQYSVGLRSQVSLDKSNAPGWLKDESSYRAIVRADGQGQWNSPISPKHGDPVSWCVALEDRTE